MIITLTYENRQWRWHVTYQGLSSTGSCYNFSEALAAAESFGRLVPTQDNEPIVGSSA